MLGHIRIKVKRAAIRSVSEREGVLSVERYQFGACGGQFWDGGWGGRFQCGACGVFQ